MKKVIALESENLVQESLLSALQCTFNTPDIFIKRVEEIDTFDILVEEQKWDAVIVNFQIDYFVSMRPQKIKEFVASIRINQGMQCLLFGCTTDQYMKKSLEEVKIRVIHKVYDPRQFIVSLRIKKRRGSIEEIENIVCEEYAISPEKIHTKSRKEIIVEIRQIIMYLAKQFTKKSLKSIGRYFEGKNHATVIHSCQVVKDRIRTEQEYKNKVTFLFAKISIAIEF